MNKRQEFAFSKDVFLLGEDADGTLYWLEEPKWKCGWYWGFGYIETYTKNAHPSLSKDITSHQHADRFYPEWVFGDSQILVETPFKVEELWKLAELFESFYILKRTAELYHRGGAHISEKPTKDALTKWDKYVEINTVELPRIFEEILKIVAPSDYEIDIRVPRLE